MVKLVGIVVGKERKQMIPERRLMIQSSMQERLVAWHRNLFSVFRETEMWVTVSLLCWLFLQ